MKVSKRTCKRVIEPEWLEFLYNEIVLYVENDDVDFGIYNQNDHPFLKGLQVKLGFELIDNLEKVNDKKLDTFYFTGIKNTKIESFFSHLRNSIVHNRIFYSANGELQLEDASRMSENKKRRGEKAEISMFAKVSSFEKLKSIIEEIKKEAEKS